MQKEQYQVLVKKRASCSPWKKNSLLSFLVGGGICAGGQGVFFLYSHLGLDDNTAYCLVSVTFILLASLLTGVGLFDNLARFGGAGTLVPVTGFSNAVTSSALDTKSEGFISGVGSKIFTVAGPVLLYATVSGVLYGILYYLYTLFGR